LDAPRSQEDLMPKKNLKNLNLNFLNMENESPITMNSFKDVFFLLIWIVQRPHQQKNQHLFFPCVHFDLEEFQITFWHPSNVKITKV